MNHSKNNRVWVFGSIFSEDSRIKYSSSNQLEITLNELGSASGTNLKSVDGFSSIINLGPKGFNKITVEHYRCEAFKGESRRIEFPCGEMEIFFKNEDIQVYFEFKNNNLIDIRPFVRPCAPLSYEDRFFIFRCGGSTFKAAEFLTSSRLYCEPVTNQNWQSFFAYLGDPCELSWQQQIDVSLMFFQEYQKDLQLLSNHIEVECRELRLFLNSPRRGNYPIYGEGAIPVELARAASELNISISVQSGAFPAE